MTLRFKKITANQVLLKYKRETLSIFYGYSLVITVFERPPFISVLNVYSFGKCQLKIKYNKCKMLLGLKINQTKPSQPF